MIATLEGTISEVLDDSVVLDVNGVGYGVYIVGEDHGRLTKDSSTKLFIYEHIREQGHDLFGFTSRDTKKLFEQLLNVSGIGPKMALNMLSIGSSSAVRAAIAGGDVKFIQQANGVGKRVAERVVVELKDKVGLPGVDLASTGLLQSDDQLLQDDAVEALVALGFTVQDASKALQHVDPALSTEERVKLALKKGA